MAGVVAATVVLTADQRTEQMTNMVEASRAKLQLEIQKDKARQQWPYWRKYLYDIVKGHHFELACGAIILFNMFLVVIETDAGVGDGEAPGWVSVLTLFLLFVYTTELVVKLYVFRKDFFYEMWNVLDFLVVGVDLIFLCMSLVIQMPSISILRIFRLVKLARAFKAAKSFRELKSLLRACACALKAIFWGMLLLVMALTVWGILAVQLIHPINKDIAEYKPYLYEGCERCPRAFETVFGSMLTFWKQLVAGDSWGTLCEPIIEEAHWTAFFFMLVLVTVNLTMLNCILAVVVEAGAAAAAADEHDQAMEREKTVVGAEGRLIDLCHGLDSDASGSLTIEEFYEGFRSNQAFKECLELMRVSQADMEMIFNICDEDDSGDVDYREFVEQLRRIKHSSEQIILNYVTDIRHQVNKIRPEMLKSKKSGEADAIEEEKQVLSKEAADDQTLGEAKAVTPSDNLMSAAESMQDMPPDSFAGLLVEADNKADQIEEKATDKDQVGGLTSSQSGEIIPQAWWERIWQVNQDLVNIMREHSEQTKVTRQLLDTLVSGANVGSGGIANGGGFPAPPANHPGAAEADVGQLVPDPRGSGPAVTTALSTRGRQATDSGACCILRNPAIS